ncbi:MAG: DNA replication and repair protein RecF, partial [Coprobacillus sp.]
RSIVLSIKIGLLELIKKEIGEYPILLLDDVLSELDDVRKTKLLNLIQGKVQTFLTSTSVDGVHHQVIDSAKKISILNGQVKGENNGRE